MSDQVVTEKGTVLPLLTLKNKKYLMVAYRLQWLSEKYEHYTIDSEFLLLTDEQAVVRSTVTLFDKEGKVIRKAMATKRETKKDFPDFLEKAETSSCGRALSMLGLGTQHALSDLDEGMRLADSPLEDVPKTLKPGEIAIGGKVTEQEAKAIVEKVTEPAKVSSFRKTKVVVTPAQESEWG